MAKPVSGSFVGLDIGSQTIKVVEAKSTGSSVQVSALGIENTPPGAIQGGVIADAKALGAAIKALLNKSGISAKRSISAATGAASVVVRVIEVPRMSPAELAETMKWEVERHIPFAANDVEMSYQAIEEPGVAPDPNNPNMEVLLAVAQRDMVSAHVETLQAAGLNPIAIDVEPLAVGRALVELDSNGMRGKNVVIVNIGASQTDVSIFKGGLLRFPRAVPLAGDNFTRAIADQLGLDMNQAEEEKRENASVFMDVVGGGATTDFGVPNPENAAAGGRTPFDFSGAVFNSPFAESAPPQSPTSPPPSAFDLSDTPQAGASVYDNPFATPPEPEAPSFATPPASAEPSPFAPIGQPSPFATIGEDPSPFATTGEPSPFATPSESSSASLASAPTSGSAFGLTPAPIPDDPRARRRREVFDAILPVLGEFVTELRRSIDYFRSRYPNDTIDQILLCGGSAQIPNLDQFIQSDLGIPTAVADPFAHLNVSSKQMSSERLAQVAPAFAVAIGLATRPSVMGPEKK